MAVQKNSDEIDILQLLVRSINIFKANFLLITAFFVVACVLGLAYYFLTKKVYESKMIVSSNILTESFTKILFENATKQIEQGNRAALQSSMHISEKAANEIVTLKIEAVNKLETADIKENERFVITAEVFDPQILPELQRGLIDYLENNDFAKVRVRQKRTFYDQMIASIDKEIHDMEEFKARIFTGDFFQSTKGNVMFDPTTVNSKILELKEKRIEYQNFLELSSSVQIIEPFVQYRKHAKPRLSITLVSAGLIGLAAASIFMLLRAAQKLSAIAGRAQ